TCRVEDTNRRSVKERLVQWRLEQAVVSDQHVTPDYRAVPQEMTLAPVLPPQGRPPGPRHHPERRRCAGALQGEPMPAPDVAETGAGPRQRGPIHVENARRGVAAMQTRGENLGQLSVSMKMLRDPDPLLARRQHQEI